MRRLAKRNRNLEENKMKTKECYFYKKDEEGFLTEEKIECVATLYEKKDICDCEERFITLSYINDSVFGYDSFDRLDENEKQISNYNKPTVLEIGRFYFVHLWCPKHVLLPCPFN